MRNVLKWLSILLPITILSACDNGEISETNTPEKMPAPVVEQKTEKQQAAAPIELKVSESELSGEALYTSDKAPDSMLYDKPQQVIDGVWSAIGATAQSRYENSGHNNNLSFVITSDGVLVVNAEASYLLAEALHTEIKKITDQPVKFVVLENGQGHAMLGSNYWQAQGATVIAHKDAAHEIEENGVGILELQKETIKEKA